MDEVNEVNEVNGVKEAFLLNVLKRLKVLSDDINVSNQDINTFLLNFSVFELPTPEEVRQNHYDSNLQGELIEALDILSNRVSLSNDLSKLLSKVA